MDMNEDDFFRQVTLKVCGTLDIEKGAQQCFQYLKKIFPIDGFYLDVFDPSLGTVKNITTVSTGPRFGTDAVEPITDNNALSFLLSNSKEKSKVTISNEMEEKDDRKYSNMGMSLALEGEKLGMINFQARGWNRYTEYHAHLLALVHEPLSIAMSNTLNCQELAKIKDILSEMKNELRPDSASAERVHIIGKRFGLRNVMEMAELVSRSDSPVLLMGETGVGKDVVATAIQHASNRREGPFIKVNCGAIPENLIDSELFGHEKGAFTGAVEKKQGRFERANGGTVFLDEVGELPPPAQVRLLRVLQYKEIERVGGTQVIPVDVRIISATNQHLEEMVKTDRFREDLWFRLNMFPIMIPPLRRRVEDIPALIHYFLEEKSKELKLPFRPELAPGALERLKAYHWPGNVRELENVVERELILSQTTTPERPLTFQHVYFTPPDNVKTAPGSQYTDLLCFDEVLAVHFRRVLELTKGKIYGPGGAADLLDMHPDTFRHKLRKLGIPFGRDYRKRLRRK